MSQSIQLIVGLANPGKAYAETRHNAGAWFIETIAQSANLHLRLESKFHGFYTQGQFEKHGCHLLIPTTFMNASGQSVQACLRYHKMTPASVLVAHDDIDLPAGAVKLKCGGGDGGHNGLKDIISHLNTREFYRLRIGVGRPTHRHEVVDYVLSSPSKSDKQKINQALMQAESILPLVLQGDVPKAMQALHTDINKQGE